MTHEELEQIFSSMHLQVSPLTPSAIPGYYLPTGTQYCSEADLVNWMPSMDPTMQTYATDYPTYYLDDQSLYWHDGSYQVGANFAF